VRPLSNEGTKTLHQLLRIDIGDEPAAWGNAGFSVVDGETRIGSTVIRLRGSQNGRGILSAGIDGVVDSIDGLTISPPIPRFNAKITPIHSNLVAGLDHVVATVPRHGSHGGGADPRRAGTPTYEAPHLQRRIQSASLLLAWRRHSRGCRPRREPRSRSGALVGFSLHQPRSLGISRRTRRAPR